MRLSAIGGGIMKSRAKILKTFVPVIGVTFLIGFGFQNCANNNIQFTGHGVSTKIDALSESSQLPQQDPECASTPIPNPTQRGMQIVGADTTTVATEQMYSLSHLISCENLKLVRWTVEGGSPAEASGTSPEFKVQFAAPGLYQIKATVVSDLDSSLHYFAKWVRVTNACTGAQCENSLAEAFLSGSTLIYQGQIANVQLNLPAGAPENPLIPWMLDGQSYVTATPNQTSIALENLTLGIHEVSLELVANNPIKHTITVLANATATPRPLPENCDLSLVGLSGPTSVIKGISASYHIEAPQCVKEVIGSIQWNFSDEAAPSVGGETSTHTFSRAGNFAVIAQLFPVNQSLLNSDAKNPFATVQLQISVSDSSGSSSGVVVPLTDPGSGSSTSGCGTLAENQIISLPPVITTAVVACGVDGHRTDTFSETKTKQCLGGVLVSGETTKQLRNTGTCEAQSCIISDTLKLKDGASQVLFSQSTPKGSCDTVSSKRTCTNGQLSGASTAVASTCLSGCGDQFGAHGTITIVDGEPLSKPKACTYNETNIVDIFKTTLKKMCDNGKVTTVADSYAVGEKITSGQCPVYQWTETGRTTCDADCGGNQQALYVCRDDRGTSFTGAEERRCGLKPTATYACSRTPDMISTKPEDLYEQGGSLKCQAGYIGGIILRKTITHTTRCLDNKLVTTDNRDKVQWITDNYCVEVKTARCSNDSLAPMRAWARLEWMKQCKDAVPYIGAFLKDIKDIKDSPIFELNQSFDEFRSTITVPLTKFEKLVATIQSSKKKLQELKAAATKQGGLNNENIDAFIAQINALELSPEYRRFSEKRDPISPIAEKIAQMRDGMLVFDVTTQKQVNEFLLKIRATSNELLTTASTIDEAIAKLNKSTNTKEPSSRAIQTQLRGLASVNAVSDSALPKDLLTLQNSLKNASAQLVDSIKADAFKKANIEIGRLTYASFQKGSSKNGGLVWETWLPPGAPNTANSIFRDANYGLKTITSNTEYLDVSKMGCQAPSTLKVASICTSSCTTAQSQLLTDYKASKQTPFIEALKNNLPSIATLTKDSSLSNFKLQQTKVDHFITEFEDAHIQLLVFNMASGKQVEFTKNHPILTARGEMKIAENFKVGDTFVTLDRKQDAIKSITPKEIFGKVYNVILYSEEPKENILVTEGYLNGTSWYQNAGSDLVNQNILAGQLTAGVVQRK